MAMTYDDLLEQIIARGLVSVQDAFRSSPEKLAGAIEGFEACRKKRPHELTLLWLRYGTNADLVRHDVADNGEGEYWRLRTAQMQIEWTMNVISVSLQLEGHPPLLSWLPTARAVRLYGDIVGVAKGEEHGST